MPRQRGVMLVWYVSFEQSMVWLLAGVGVTAMRIERMMLQETSFITKYRYKWKVESE